MRHSRSIDRLSLPGCWLTIGVFDGVHLGHRAILSTLVQGAHADGLPAAVLTFHPHPGVALNRTEGLKYLTLPDERAALLGELGVDEVITMPFSRALALLTPEEFMGLVQDRLHARQLLVGYDFALGRGRTGTVARLTELGAEFGYSLRSFEPVSEAGEPVSSSRIRAVLADGAVEQAARLLGRPYFLEGPVVHGDGRGRTINIPTANLQVPEEKALPANGVYACRAWVEGVAHAAVTNVGVRPTFDTDRPDPHVEAHLLDFARDLYGLPVRLEFIARLRGERKFPSVEALIAQIRADIQTARGIL